MRVGFSGTQVGTTDEQLAAVVEYLKEIKHRYQHHKLRALFAFGDFEFHFGDCIGADEEVAEEAYKLGYNLHVHPSTLTKKRAFVNKRLRIDVVNYDPKPPLNRNHDIVDAVKYFIATPKEQKEVLRSGTWATIRYAKKRFEAQKLDEYRIFYP